MFAEKATSIRTIHRARRNRMSYYAQNERALNKLLLLIFFPLLLLCSIAQKNPLQKYSRARRYERGSKINKMSHVLDLRRVVERLSALK